MPATRLSGEVSRSGGSYIIRESTHNRHRFSSARDDASRPYPSANDVYVRSTSSTVHEDEFSDLGLSDFFIAHRRVARRNLERLQLTPLQAGLFSRGVQTGIERREPYNEVLEAAIGYAGSCSVAVMDEVANVNEKIDGVDGRAFTMRQEIDELRELNEALRVNAERDSRAMDSLRREVGTLKHLVNGLVEGLGSLRDDVMRWRLVDRHFARTGMLPIMGRAESVPSSGPTSGPSSSRTSSVSSGPPQELVHHEGRLVPIETPDRAEVRPVIDLTDDEVIDLTDDSDDVVVDLTGEEEEQARLAREAGEVTFHAEVERARADPSPEYRSLPNGPPPPY